MQNLLYFIFFLIMYFHTGFWLVHSDWHYLRYIHAETVDPTTLGIRILPCDYALDIIVLFVGGLWSCLIDIFHWPCIILGTLQFSRLHYKLFDVLLYWCTCLCLLCTVVCMHNVHTAYICMVCNNVICTNIFNFLPYCIMVILLEIMQVILCIVHWNRILNTLDSGL